MITPYKMCQKYASHRIDRGTLKEFLITWDYEPSDEIDTVLFEMTGSWSDVEKAHWEGLIDDTLYDEVMDMLILAND